MTKVGNRPRRFISGNGDIPVQGLKNTAQRNPSRRSHPNAGVLMGAVATTLATTLLTYERVSSAPPKKKRRRSRTVTGQPMPPSITDGGALPVRIQHDFLRTDQYTGAESGSSSPHVDRYRSPFSMRNRTQDTSLRFSRSWKVKK